MNKHIYFNFIGKDQEPTLLHPLYLEPDRYRQTALHQHLDQSLELLLEHHHSLTVLVLIYVFIYEYLWIYLHLIRYVYI
jgi:hypothetical protein